MQILLCSVEGMALHMYLHSLFTCHCINLLHCKIQYLPGSYTFSTTSRKKEIIKLFVKERNLSPAWFSPAAMGGKKATKTRGTQIFRKHDFTLWGSVLVDKSQLCLSPVHPHPGWLVLESHTGSAALQTLKPPRALPAVTPNCWGCYLPTAQSLLWI